MKAVSPALLATLTSAVPTIGHACKVELRDGTVLGFTGHDRTFDLDGVTYTAAAGVDASDISSNCMLEVAGLELTGPLVSPYITADILRAGLWDSARVIQFIYNYDDLSEGVMYTAWGSLGEVTIERGRFKCEFRDLIHTYSTGIIELTSATCRAKVGDTRCGFDIGTLAVTGTVDSIDSDRVTIHDATRTEAPHPSGTHYFIGGVLTWDTGDNAGLQMEIREHDHATGTLQLGLPMAYTVQAGDTYTLTPGCPKLPADCRGTFDNYVRFRGEPDMGGNDLLFQVGRDS